MEQNYASKTKKRLCQFLCIAIVIGLLSPLGAHKANASYTITVPLNGTKKLSFGAGSQTIYATLTGAYTGVKCMGKPTWVSWTKSGSTYVISVSENTGSSKRSGSIDFTEGLNKWTIYLEQTGKPTPTPKPATPTPKPKTPTPKPATPTPKPATPTPKPATPTLKPVTPTNTPTPTSIPELVASPNSISLDYRSQSKSIQLSGVTGSGTEVMGKSTWITVNGSGSTYTITVEENATTDPRNGTVVIQDKGSKATVTISVSQERRPPVVPTNTPTPKPATPTPKPATPTPTPKPNNPTPSPTPYLTVNSATREYGCAVATDTITVNGCKGSLTFSDYQWNPSTQKDWVTLIYDGSSIKVSVNRNNTYAARSVKVKITDNVTGESAYITITQKPAPKPTATPTPYLSINPSTRTFPSQGGRDTVTMNGKQGDIEWSASNDETWAWVERNSSGEYAIVVGPNQFANERSVIVTFKDKKTGRTAEVLVKQESNSNPIKVVGNSDTEEEYEDFYKLTNYRYTSTKDISVEPYNSSVEKSSSVTMSDYWSLYNTRKHHYRFQSDSDLASFIFFALGGEIGSALQETLDDSFGYKQYFPSKDVPNAYMIKLLVEGKINLADIAYLKDIYNRAGLIEIAGQTGYINPLTPTAGKLLNHYLYGDGSKFTFSIRSFLNENSLVSNIYNNDVSNIMRAIEQSLKPGDSITFVDKNAGDHSIQFLDDEIDGFFGLKWCSYGMAASCSFDGSTYTMDLNLYIQDYYDFYYPNADDWQANNVFLGVTGNELAFLVPFRLATPFKSTGVFKTTVTWHEGDKMDVYGSVENIISPNGYASVEIRW